MSSDTYLRKRVPYAGTLIFFLFLVTFLHWGQASLLNASFVSVFAVQAHILLLVLAIFTSYAADRSFRSAGAIEETPIGFMLAFLIGLGPIYIYLSWTELNIALEDVSMIVYFFSGAAIEELVFRYTLPRFLHYSEGYSVIRSHLISNFSFSLLHWFVWNMSPSAFFLGAGFGFANAIVFQVTGSFIGIVWSHALHNLYLSGASGFAMGLMSLVIFMSIFLQRYLKKPRR